jgi:DNA-binding XRE family transcriptional regulator
VSLIPVNPLTSVYYLYIIKPMTNQDFKSWRKKWGLSQGKLAKALGVRSMTVARWEWGKMRIPALLPLALEALDHRLQKGGKHELISGVPGVQAAE